MHDHPTILGSIDYQTFLDNYWQKQPLLIKQAIKDYDCPISPEELAGLSMEDDVESRLVIQSGDNWECRYGPFEEKDFNDLPESHWTLLLQGANRYVIELAELLDRFQFVPEWRLDDIMVSYASNQGSVGPHTDNYDVFLLQAEGVREWQIASISFDEAQCIPGLDLNILRKFKPQQRWTLEKGDMLYLPPGIAHFGIAQGPCMTISIGFRAANTSQMIHAFADFLLSRYATQFDSQFYQDAQLRADQARGLLDQQALENFQTSLNHALQQHIQEPDWIAGLLTDAGTADPPETIISHESLVEQLQQGACLRREEASRFVYLDSGNGRLRLFINGELIQCNDNINDKVLIELLSSRHRLDYPEIQDYLSDSLLLHCLNQGFWYIDDSL